MCVGGGLLAYVYVHACVCVRVGAHACGVYTHASMSIFDRGG